MTDLGQLTQIKGRFARSVRIDTGDAVDALDGYLPTARSLEVVRRVVRGMLDPKAGARAFSITGPYGSGKSSLAIFLDALVSPADSAAFAAARALLQEHDPRTAEGLDTALATMGAGSQGFARAVVTAPQREPITATVLRALHRSVAEGAPFSKGLRNDILSALRRAEDPGLGSPSYADVRALMEAVARKRPILLVIDEFGKNLEAFADAGADGDMYLLQELAEWASSGELDLVVVTIQHLAFEAYAADATAVKRREWAKVQGRFEDIPFVDSAAATRELIAVALTHDDDHSDVPAYREMRRSAASVQVAIANELGLAAVSEESLVAKCYPLHPTTLMVLPELCSRFGQNERTLFSFLASGEPLSVASFLSDSSVEDALPWVRLERVYDYFVESASTFVGIARDAGRWIEVETAIRDAHGLTSGQERVLKTVGVLNLVASSGTVRASRDLIGFACADGADGTEDQAAVLARLAELEAHGLITYRDFASEYRIWRGSDFDLNGAVSLARRQVRERTLALTLSEVLPLAPIVAARHTTERATVRAFKRIYADGHTSDFLQQLPAPGDVCDGLLVYALEELGDFFEVRSSSTPVLVVEPKDPAKVISASVEVAALQAVSVDPGLPVDDSAVRREILERLAYARQRLDQTLADSYDQWATWTWVNPPDGGPRALEAGFGSRVLSDVLDEVYPDASSPTVAYEVINRAELTSAGARARRNLLAAIVDPLKAGEECLGFPPDSPEGSTYAAVLAASGIHDEGAMALRSPTDPRWKPAWDALREQLRSAEHPVSVSALFDTLMTSPFGLREGTASVMLTALVVVEARGLAIYEHGTFTPRFTADVAERLIKNPRNFAIKSLDTRSKRRREYIGMLNDALDYEGLPADLGAGKESVLSSVRRLVRVLQGAPKYALKTTAFYGLDLQSAADVMAVRRALLEATEPDVLLFHDLPEALGHEPIAPRKKRTDHELKQVTGRIALALQAVGQAYDGLLDLVVEMLTANAIGPSPSGKPMDVPDRIMIMQGHAVGLREVETLAPVLRRFTHQVSFPVDPEDERDVRDWAARIAVGLADGVPPQDWRDADIPGYLRRIADTAAAFQRTATLAQSLSSSGSESFEAYAVSLSDANGDSVLSGIAAILEKDREEADAALSPAIDQLTSLVGGRHEALRMVVAWIANELNQTEGRVSPPGESELANG